MKATLVERAALSHDDRLAMCQLLDRYFLGVDFDGFERDLVDKDFALLLRDETGQLCGFTTLGLEQIPDGEPGAWVLYSGDTIVDLGQRSSAALAACWIDAVYRLRAEKRIERLVWLLICSSVRTYHFLPLFFRDFAPHPAAPTAVAVQSELDLLAVHRYGSAYDPATGIVRLERPQPLRSGEAEGATRRESRELLQFFERRNPGHALGDELVCHCVIDDANLTAAGRRMVESGRRRGRAGS